MIFPRNSPIICIMLLNYCILYLSSMRELFYSKLPRAQLCYKMYVCMHMHMYVCVYVYIWKGIECLLSAKGRQEKLYLMYTSKGKTRIQVIKR